MRNGNMRIVQRVAAGTIAVACVLGTGAASAMLAQPSGSSANLSYERLLGHELYGRVQQHNVSSIYMVESPDQVQRYDVSERMPWTLHVQYSLDGPNVDAAHVHNASGLVGMDISLTRNELASAQMNQTAQQLRPMVAFTIPTRSCKDIVVDKGVIASEQGNTTVIAAIGEPGGNLHFHVYADATGFSTSPIVMTALYATDAHAYAHALASDAQHASTLTDAVAHVNAQHGSALIQELTKLKNHELDLAKQDIAQQEQKHRRAFDAYMAAYVSSYTNHLSGGIGDTTQLGALMGTAGELKGDTALAHAVTNLATAVNNVSDAYQHEGAAAEVEAVIRRIQRQGTQGLTHELEEKAGQSIRQGDKDYASGQSQLSQAMIPYSMAYTDVYTSHLSDLTGGTSNGASQYAQQAIAATNEEFKTNPDLAPDTQKVNAAMQSLANARKETGAGSAAKELLERYRDQFADGASQGNASDTLMQSSLAQQHPINMLVASEHEDGIRATIHNSVNMQYSNMKLKEEQERKKKSQQHHDDSLVTQSSNDAAADVMKYAGKFGTGSANSSAPKDKSAAAQTPALALSESQKFAFSLGAVGKPTTVQATSQQLIDDTSSVADAAPVLAALSTVLDSQQLPQAPVCKKVSCATQLTLVYPSV